MARSDNDFGFSNAFICVLFIAIVFIGFYLDLRFGPLPMAVADSAFPFEKQIVKIPLRARINRELKTALFGPSDEVSESGAHIYRDQCSLPRHT